jgi:thiamine pyrophosphokinase
MNALVLAGGELAPTALVRRFSQAAIIIAADSGLHHAQLLGLQPDLIVGDFDSVDKTVLKAFAEVPRETFPADKDWLDLELAIQAAIKRGAKSLRLMGVLGKRLDQTLAALLIAARLKQEGFEVSLHGAKQDIFLLSGLEDLQLDLPLQQLFSLLSLSPVSRLSLENAHYPLHNFELGFGLGLGVSNRVIASPLKLSLSSGLLALIIERSEDEGSSQNLG